MKPAKYLLIGGGLASSQAAKQLREKDPAGSITLVSEERHAPYDRPPLSKEFLRGEKSVQNLFYDPESYFHDRRIDLLLGVAVTRLDPSTKTATLAGGETLSFEKALLATGGRPVTLKMPGSALPGVHYLRTLDDSAAVAGERLRKGIRNSDLVIFERSGHFPYVEEPDVFFATIRNWLVSVIAPSPK